MTDDTVVIVIRGETLILHPERAVIWPRRRTVIVADTHFGKTSYFGRHGIAVPAGSDEADRQRLSALLAAVDARRLIVLGDFVHARLPAGSVEAAELQAWAERLARTLEIHVIVGNHDRHASRLTDVHWWETNCEDPPFCFTHDADRGRSRSEDSRFTLSGHIHPVIRLKSQRKSTLRVPVFWQRRNGLILPSFGLFTGGFAITPEAHDRIFGVGPGAVVAL